MEKADIEIKKETQTDGTVTSRLDVEIGQTGTERTDRFYNETAKRLEAWYDGVFAAWAEEEYRRSDDDRKKWRFPVYTFAVRGKTENVPGGKLAVALYLSYGKGGAETVKKTRRTVWSKGGKRILKTGFLKPSKMSSNR